MRDLGRRLQGLRETLSTRTAAFIAADAARGTLVGRYEKCYLMKPKGLLGRGRRYPHAPLLSLPRTPREGPWSGGERARRERGGQWGV
jgi:hypothetical protein